MTTVGGQQVCAGTKDEKATRPSPGFNPANWTSAKFDAAVDATVYVNAPLPSGWYLELGGPPSGRIWCGPEQLRCQHTFGPYPGPVADELIEAFICRSSDNWCGALLLKINIYRQ